MTTLMNISLACLIFLCAGFTSFSQNEAELQPHHYCNEKFNFCANYPSSLLPFKATLTQNNGIVLRSDDGFAEVIIAGYRQPTTESTEKAFLTSIQQQVKQNGDLKIISSIFGEDFYECSFIIGLNFSYHKSYYFDDHFVRLEIKVPISNPVMLKSLKAEIDIDFKTEGQRIEQQVSNEIIP